ncbi:MAG: hypothetical protein V1850_02120 [Candidatus Bathyarchaeota archaeon]
MDLETRCPKCRGAMREGELYITFTSSEGQVAPSLFGLPTESTLRIEPESDHEGPLLWRDGTVQKGLFVKREETQVLRVSGLRCIECGYIELYIDK